MLHTPREIPWFTRGHQDDPWAPPGFRDVASVLAVLPLELASNRANDGLLELARRLRPRQEFDADAQGGVVVLVRLELEHELTGDVRGDRSLLEPERHVLGVDVGAVVRHRETGAPEHEDERHVARRSLSDERQWIEPVVAQEREHRRMRDHSAAIEDAVTDERHAAVSREQEVALDDLE